MKRGNVVLIGMPGAGKSTVGVVLSKVIGLGFVDADIVIQEREKRLLNEIIEQDGLERFLDIEGEVNSSFHLKDTVIATGGSVIYREEAMKHLREIGTVVYIKLSLETLKQRLGNIKQRGVVLKDGQDLDSLYYERCPLYEKYAHVTIDSEGCNVEELLEKIRVSL
ncbi:shikimate kinase I [Lachnospiraceae bacterium KM106-2]|nr:shikimate kinase I [Lachnospiraceae bacterium KM106-2]